MSLSSVKTLSSISRFSTLAFGAQTLSFAFIVAVIHSFGCSDLLPIIFLAVFIGKAIMKDLGSITL
jgi:hypothetical protein